MRSVGLSLTVVLGACSVAEPDELEIRVTTGAIARDVLSQVNVIVDPPRAFLRDPGAGELAPGVTFEFVTAGASNRMLVSFRPPPGTTTLAEDLVFTAVLYGGFGELGEVHVIGYDLAGQAIARADRLDVPFGGFEAVTLTLECPEAGCAPSPGLGGYPFTLDIGDLVPSNPAAGPARLTMAHSSAPDVPPSMVRFVYGDPDFDGQRGRIVVFDLAGASNPFDFDSPMNACVIHGDAPGDQLGASVAFAQRAQFSGFDNGFMAVGAPGAGGGAGAVYVLQVMPGSPTCPTANISAQSDLVVRLEASGSTYFGNSLAATGIAGGSGTGRLVIGGRAPNAGDVYMVGDLSGASGVRTLGTTNSLVLRGGPRSEFGRVVAAANIGGVPMIAIGTGDGAVVVMSGPDVIGPATGERISFSAQVNIVGTEAIDALAITYANDQTDCTNGSPLLVIGSPLALDPTGARTGAVFATSVLSTGGHGIDCATDGCLYGIQEGDELGAAIMSGSFRTQCDVAIGAPGARRPDGAAQAGAVYVFSNEMLQTPAPALRPAPQFGRDPDDSTLRLLYRLYGTQPGGRFGAALAMTELFFAIAGVGDGTRDSFYRLRDFTATWGPQ